MCMHPPARRHCSTPPLFPPKHTTGSHLETRASALMRKIYTAATAPPKPPKEPKAKPPKTPRGMLQQGNAPRVEFTWPLAESYGRGEDWCDQVLGGETLTLVRKLRTLEKKKDELEYNKWLTKMIKYLVCCLGGCMWCMCAHGRNIIIITVVFVNMVHP